MLKTCLGKNKNGNQNNNRIHTDEQVVHAFAGTAAGQTGALARVPGWGRGGWVGVGLGVGGGGGGGGGVGGGGGGGGNK
jgi:hypothetical protein